MRVVVDHVSKTYTVRGQDAVTALSEIDVTVESQELVALVGPSGCGKSTLLNILAGLLAPTTGAVFFEGALGAGRPATAMVFQEFALFLWRTVQGNVALLSLLGVLAHWGLGALERLAIPWRAG